MDEVVDLVVGCAGGAEVVGLEEQLFDDEGTVGAQFVWMSGHAHPSRGGPDCARLTVGVSTMPGLPGKEQTASHPVDARLSE